MDKAISFKRKGIINCNKWGETYCKKLNRIYFVIDVLKYILPEEIKRNRAKAPIQNLIKTRISDFLDLGQEKILDFDNSINSFVGCCSLGTGHFASCIKY